MEGGVDVESERARERERERETDSRFVLRVTIITHS